jgi:hypothetical protein
MNLGWLDETTDDTEWRRVVVHEFGHALGCIHEHQSPNEHLNWDRDAVYRYFSRPPNNWSKEEIDQNILEKYSPEGITATLFDPDSIMLYMFPPELLLDHKGTNNNTDLSDMDKALIQQMYPKPTTRTSESHSYQESSRSHSHHGPSRLHSHKDKASELA